MDLGQNISGRSKICNLDQNNLEKIKVFFFQVCCPSYTFCCNDGQKCCHNNHNPLGQIFTTLKEAPLKVLPVKEIAKPVEGIYAECKKRDLKTNQKLSFYSNQLTKPIHFCQFRRTIKSRQYCQPN